MLTKTLFMNMKHKCNSCVSQNIIILKFLNHLKTEKLFLAHRIYKIGSGFICSMGYSLATPVLEQLSFPKSHK